MLLVWKNSLVEISQPGYLLWGNILLTDSISFVDRGLLRLGMSSCVSFLVVFFQESVYFINIFQCIGTEDIVTVSYTFNTLKNIHRIAVMTSFSFLISMMFLLFVTSFTFLGLKLVHTFLLLNMNI